MYQYCDSDDRYITLHDCKAEKMGFENNVLSFIFPDGFWVLPQHPQNQGNDTLRTNTSQVDFEIIDKEIDGISIYVFTKVRNGTVVREEWELNNFITAVNTGNFQVEFLTQYKSFQSLLFQCWVWFPQSPYHAECEIILHTARAAYRWDYLRYDRVW